MFKEVCCSTIQIFRKHMLRLPLKDFTPAELLFFGWLRRDCPSIARDAAAATIVDSIGDASLAAGDVHWTTKRFRRPKLEYQYKRETQDAVTNFDNYD
uniref:Transposase n=1 Tax=Romanomermis culicivorax TaxID=13658 RepID=A0A915KY30_ROMCU